MQDIALFSLAALGGAINSVAGGGSFLVFPALVLTGMPAIAANATTTMALWPGSVSAAFAYRKLLGERRDEMPSLVLTSLAGGALGACILLLTPERVFSAMIPWLLLAATLIFSFGGKILERFPVRGEPTPARRVFARMLQFIIGAYGGYFGAGIGILMLAMLQLLGYRHIHAMNAVKTVLGSCINGLAVLIFIAAGIIVWDKALLMLAGAVLGGYAAANLAQKVAPGAVRIFVSAVGFSLTIFFFARG